MTYWIMTYWGNFLPKHINTYEDAKQLYESIPVLHSKQHDRSLDIRPIGLRRYWYDRIAKVKGGYTVGGWGYNGISYCVDPFITWKRNELIVHVPKRNRLSDSHTNTVYWSVLPADLTFVNYRTKNYIKCDGKHYALIEDLHFKRIDGKWVVQNPPQEYKLVLDKQKTKEIRKKLQPFLAYMRPMITLMQSPDKKTWPYRTWPYQSPFASNSWKQYITRKSHWYDVVKHYMARCIKEVWNGGTWTYVNPTVKQVWAVLYKDIIKKERPFKKIPVPIGEMCYSSYESIVRAKGRL